MLTSISLRRSSALAAIKGKFICLPTCRNRSPIVVISGGKIKFSGSEMPNEKFEINAIFTPIDRIPPVSLSHFEADYTPGPLLDLPFQAMPKLVPELPFKYFTGRVLGKRMDNLHRFGRLIVSKVLFAKFDNIHFRNLTRLLQYDNGVNLLYPIWVRDTKASHSGYKRAFL